MSDNIIVISYILKFWFAYEFEKIRITSKKLIYWQKSNIEYIILIWIKLVRSIINEN